MLKFRILLIAAITVSLTPAALAADDFCGALNKIIADADNGFQNVSQKSTVKGAQPFGTVTIPGFPAITGTPDHFMPGTSADEMKSCHVPYSGMFACMTFETVTADLGADAKKCLEGWAFQEVVAGAKVTDTLTKGKMTVSVDIDSTMHVITSLTITDTLVKNPLTAPDTGFIQKMIAPAK